MYEYRAVVVAVHDGDTISLDVDCGFDIHIVRLEVRLSGVDAPELKRSDQLGEQARDSLSAWLVAHPGPYIAHTEKDHTEKYGRYLLGALTAADHRELINDGLAAGWLKFYSGRGLKPVWP